ncbi:Ureidoglycolate lyase [Myotisia sp. PD_48]|nr:Ureidoglycolate lyase [Myotisia sp. PD_48]
MNIPPSISAPELNVTAVPITPESFQPYGTVILNPLPKELDTPPTDLSGFESFRSTPKLGNQGSALRWGSISPVTESYGTNGSTQKGVSHMSMFSCFPRALRDSSSSPSQSSPSFLSSIGPQNKNISGIFDARFLERHPYTSQTFIPLSTSSRAGAPNAVEQDAIYLVIVAPTLKGQSATARSAKDESGKSNTVQISDPPDLENICAFTVRPGQAVTYAAGTWHAPMIVLGRERIDFVVTQYMNGIAQEDCEIIALNPNAIVDVQGSLNTTAKL